MENKDIIFQKVQETDPTWDHALKLVKHVLPVPSNIVRTMRLSWEGFADTNELLKLLGFSGFPLNNLVRAAEIEAENTQSSYKDVKHAVSLMGVRVSVAVLAISWVTCKILAMKPPPIWRKIYEEMMTYIEIGYKLGSRVPELGPAGGMLIGFCRGAGLSTLMAFDNKIFRKWYSLTNGVENREIQVQMFGCEPYQVGAFILQQLGFGSDIAAGTAIAVGNLSLKHIHLERETMRWCAGYYWIEALLEGRNYPADLKTRNFFAEIAPSKSPGAQNTVLQVLHAEVAKVRREGSTWRWHLPYSTYEECLEKINGIKNAQQASGAHTTIY